MTDTQRLARIQTVAKWMLGLCWLCMGVPSLFQILAMYTTPLTQTTGYMFVHKSVDYMLAINVLEIALGLFLIANGRGLWCFSISLAAISLGIVISGLLTQFEVLKLPFNSLSVGMGMIGLCMVGLTSLPAADSNADIQPYKSV